MTETESPRKKTLPPLWVLSTYFAEGFPYSLVRQISTVFFKDHGASLEAVGMTSLYGLPWILKLLWAPLADAFSTKRRWILSLELLLAGAAAAMALGSAMTDPLSVVAVLFLVTAFLSATHDIAIDGFYLEALDKRRQAAFVGYQAMAYRLALIAGGGGVAVLSDRFGWPAGFALAGILLGLLMLYHGAFLPKVETPKQPGWKMASWFLKPSHLFWPVACAGLAAGLYRLWSLPLVQSAVSPARPVLDRLNPPAVIALTLLAAVLLLLLNLGRLKRRLQGADSFYAKAFVDYLDQDRIGVILAFLILYRTGESCILAMVYPMLKEIGLDRGDYGIIYGTFGIAASIAGGILGGHLIGRLGLKRVIWPLVLAQNVPNLLYAALAWIYRPLTGHPELGAASPYAVAPFVVLEAFGAGMGTAAFMVFIMRTCRPSFRSAHMSIATGIMNVSSTLAGVFSGFLAKWMGWPAFFVFTFFATFPGMALLFRLPYLEENEGGGVRGGDGEKKT